MKVMPCLHCQPVLVTTLSIDVASLSTFNILVEEKILTKPVYF